MPVILEKVPDLESYHNTLLTLREHEAPLVDVIKQSRISILLSEQLNRFVPDPSKPKKRVPETEQIEQITKLAVPLLFTDEAATPHVATEIGSLLPPEFDSSQLKFLNGLFVHALATGARSRSDKYYAPLANQMDIAFAALNYAYSTGVNVPTGAQNEDGTPQYIRAQHELFDYYTPLTFGDQTQFRTALWPFTTHLLTTGILPAQVTAEHIKNPKPMLVNETLRQHFDLYNQLSIPSGTNMQRVRISAQALQIAIERQLSRTEDAAQIAECEECLRKLSDFIDDNLGEIEFGKAALNPNWFNLVHTSQSEIPGPTKSMLLHAALPTTLFQAYNDEGKIIDKSYGVFNSLTHIDLIPLALARIEKQVLADELQHGDIGLRAEGAHKIMSRLFEESGLPKSSIASVIGDKDVISAQAVIDGFVAALKDKEVDRRFQTVNPLLSAASIAILGPLARTINSHSDATIGQLSSELTADMTHPVDIAAAISVIEKAGVVGHEKKPEFPPLPLNEGELAAEFCSVFKGADRDVIKKLTPFIYVFQAQTQADKGHALIASSVLSERVIAFFNGATSTGKTWLFRSMCRYAKEKYGIPIMWSEFNAAAVKGDAWVGRHLQSDIAAETQEEAKKMRLNRDQLSLAGEKVVSRQSTVLLVDEAHSFFIQPPARTQNEGSNMADEMITQLLSLTDDEPHPWSFTTKLGDGSFADVTVPTNNINIIFVSPFTAPGMQEAIRDANTKLGKTVPEGMWCSIDSPELLNEVKGSRKDLARRIPRENYIVFPQIQTDMVARSITGRVSDYHPLLRLEQKLRTTYANRRHSLAELTIDPEAAKYLAEAAKSHLGDRGYQAVKDLIGPIVQYMQSHNIQPDADGQLTLTEDILKKALVQVVKSSSQDKHAFRPKPANGTLL